MNNRILAAAAVALPVLVVGCANTTPTKEVAVHPELHLAQFAPATLNPKVAAMLPRGEPELGFRRLDIDVHLAEVRSDQVAARDSVTSSLHYINAGDGLVQYYEEVRNNDVPFRINYKLSYRGFLQLKWQTVFLSRPNSDLPWEVKTLKQIDAMGRPAAGSMPMNFAFTYGAQMQIANYSDGRETCTLGTAAPASELHPKLAGEWRELSCDNYGPNGVVSSKASYAYLTRYGVVVPHSFANSVSRNTYQIKSVRVE